MAHQAGVVQGHVALQKVGHCPQVGQHQGAASGQAAPCGEAKASQPCTRPQLHHQACAHTRPHEICSQTHSHRAPSRAPTTAQCLAKVPEWRPGVCRNQTWASPVNHKDPRCVLQQDNQICCAREWGKGVNGVDTGHTWATTQGRHCICPHPVLAQVSPQHLHPRQRTPTGGSHTIATESQRA